MHKNFEGRGTSSRRSIESALTHGKPLLKLIASVSPARAAVLGATGRARPEPIFGSFLVDTGSMRSHIDLQWARPLKLVSTGVAHMLSTTSGPSPAKRSLYEIGLFIPSVQDGDGATVGDGLLLESFPVIGLDLSGQGIHGILGLDVIGNGRLTLDGRSRSFALEY